jgi:photosystem II stability/assembly factor-like uncharacterized protein
MEKLFFSIHFLLILTFPLSSQNGWVPLNPGFGHVYNSVHFINESTGMACGYAGAVIKTSNGGLNWFNLNSATNVNLNDVKMFTSLIAAAVGDNQLILRTTNGGENWYIVYQNGPQSNTIMNLNVHNGVQATAYSRYYQSPYEYTYIYRSSDMGANWQITQTYVTNRSIHFINLNTGWAHGTTFTGPPLNQYYLDINKTTNGGATWSLIYRSDGTSINPGIIYFYNESFGFKIVHIGHVYLSRTLTGGTSWIASIGLPSNYSSIIRCFWFVNQSIGWFVADNSNIYCTANSGAEWIQQQSPVAANLSKVYFINENTGWIAAGSQGILKTTNGGISGIQKVSSEIPSEFSLSQNYPNPFNPATNIKFQIPKTTSVKMLIFDMLGREVETLVNEQLKPGTYQADWNASIYPSGVYFYKLIADGYVETKKMILIK